MAYRLAYGASENIAGAIVSEVIPKGSIILTTDSDEIRFYDPYGKLRTYLHRRKFDSMEQAQSWTRSNKCAGQMFSILIDNRYIPHIVQPDGTIEILPGYTDPEPVIVEASSHLEFPNVGKPNTLYVAAAENDGFGFVYRWDATQNKYFNVTENNDTIERIDGGHA